MARTILNPMNLGLVPDFAVIHDFFLLPPPSRPAPVAASSAFHSTFAAMKLCGATNRQGTACRAPAMRGRERCRLHGGHSTGRKHGKRKAVVASIGLRCL